MIRNNFVYCDTSNCYDMIQVKKLEHKMQNKNLFEIFEENPDSYPESVLFQDGLEDYIEDIVWKQKPVKCSEKNRINIDRILKSHVSQEQAIIPLIEHERKNGKGSLRKFTGKGFKIPERIKNLPEWKEIYPSY